MSDIPPSTCQERLLAALEACNNRVGLLEAKVTAESSRVTHAVQGLTSEVTSRCEQLDSQSAETVARVEALHHTMETTKRDAQHQEEKALQVLREQVQEASGKIEGIEANVAGELRSTKKVMLAQVTSSLSRVESECDQRLTEATAAVMTRLERTSVEHTARLAEVQIMIEAERSRRLEVEVDLKRKLDEATGLAGGLPARVSSLERGAVAHRELVEATRGGLESQIAEAVYKETTARVAEAGVLRERLEETAAGGGFCEGQAPEGKAAAEPQASPAGEGGEGGGEGEEGGKDLDPFEAKFASAHAHIAMGDSSDEAEDPAPPAPPPRAMPRRMRLEAHELGQQLCDARGEIAGLRRDHMEDMTRLSQHLTDQIRHCLQVAGSPGRGARPSMGSMGPSQREEGLTVAWLEQTMKSEVRRLEALQSKTHREVAPPLPPPHRGGVTTLPLLPAAATPRDLCPCPGGLF
jgi:hypothetical protein